MCLGTVLLRLFTPPQPPQVKLTTSFLTRVRDKFISPALADTAVGDPPAAVLCVALAWGELALLAWRVGGEKPDEMLRLSAPVIYQRADVSGGRHEGGLMGGLTGGSLHLWLLALQRLRHRRFVEGPTAAPDKEDVAALVDMITAVAAALRIGALAGGEKRLYRARLSHEPCLLSLGRPFFWCDTQFHRLSCHIEFTLTPPPPTPTYPPTYHLPPPLPHTTKHTTNPPRSPMPILSIQTHLLVTQSRAPVLMVLSLQPRGWPSLTTSRL
jgi:hypothetical protein